MREYLELLAAMIDRLPWFGEEPFVASAEPLPARDVLAQPRAVRRILLAFLAGRPVSSAARRAGCSVRLLYKALYQIIYVPCPEAMVEDWARLGLIAAVDGPANALEELVAGLHGAEAEPRDGVVVCLLCHRLLGGAALEERWYDGRLVEPEEDGLPTFALPWDAVVAVQAHLILHFPLGLDPIPQAPYRRNPGLKHWTRAEGNPWDAWPFSQGAQNRRESWQEVVPVDVLGLIQDDRHRGGSRTRPIVAGRTLSAEAAEARWRKMLPAPESSRRRPRGRS